MNIKDAINKAIQEEIANDPHNIGYAGKTDSEIRDLLNSPEQKQKVVIDILPSPMNRILTGIAGAPNAVSIEDVVDSQAIQVDSI